MVSDASEVRAVARKGVQLIRRLSTTFEQSHVLVPAKSRREACSRLKVERRGKTARAKNSRQKAEVIHDVAFTLPPVPLSPSSQATFQISSIAQQNFPHATLALREYSLTLIFSSRPYWSAKSSLPWAIAPMKTARVRGAASFASEEGRRVGR